MSLSIPYPSSIFGLYILDFTLSLLTPKTLMGRCQECFLLSSLTNLFAPLDTVTLQWKDYFFSKQKDFLVSILSYWQKYSLITFVWNSFVTLLGKSDSNILFCNQWSSAVTTCPASIPNTRHALLKSGPSGKYILFAFDAKWIVWLSLGLTRRILWMTNLICRRRTSRTEMPRCLENLSLPCRESLIIN